MKTRRTLVSALAVGVVSVATAGVALATTDVVATRLAGTDRYGTSRAIANDTFDTSTVAIVASGESYADALAASYLAGASSAPVVLVGSQTAGSQALATLAELDVSGVIVTGGTAAVTDAVVGELTGAGYQVDRVAGADRYATARAIAESVPEEQIGSLDSSIGRTALLASGQGFADALAGGPLAYASAFPMLLTPAGTLSPQVSATIDALGISQVVVLGGTAAVSPAVQAQLIAEGVDVRRVAGLDRTATAVEVAKVAIDELNFSVTHTNLARGNAFADALTGTANAGREVAPILLTQTEDQLGTATGDYLATLAGTLTTIHVYGGPAAVSDSTVNAAEVSAGRTP